MASPATCVKHYYFVSNFIVLWQTLLFAHNVAVFSEVGAMPSLFSSILWGWFQEFKKQRRLSTLSGKVKIVEQCIDAVLGIKCSA